MTGLKNVYDQNGRVTFEKQWSSIAVPYAFQAIVKELHVKEKFGYQCSTLDEVFTLNSTCFMLGYSGYGLQGKVLSVDKNMKESIRVEFDEFHDPETKSVEERSSQHYISVDDVAKQLGISTDVISRITGSIYVLLSPSEKNKKTRKGKDLKPSVHQKVNVGLCLKLIKTKEEIPGWSKRIEDEWFYSSDTIEVLKRYVTKFPEFFDFLEKHPKSYEFTDSIVFGGDGIERARKLHEFVKSLPCINAERRVIGLFF